MHILHDTAMANRAADLADEVQAALRQCAVIPTTAGTIWAYEIDGYGGHVLMDDANAPSLLSLPYLDSSPDTALYARTRTFVWSEQNPWFAVRYEQLTGNMLSKAGHFQKASEMYGNIMELVKDGGLGVQWTYTK